MNKDLCKDCKYLDEKTYPYCICGHKQIANLICDSYYCADRILCIEKDKFGCTLWENRGELK